MSVFTWADEVDCAERLIGTAPGYTASITDGSTHDYNHFSVTVEPDEGDLPCEVTWTDGLFTLAEAKEACELIAERLSR